MLEGTPSSKGLSSEEVRGKGSLFLTQGQIREKNREPFSKEEGNKPREKDEGEKLASVGGGEFGCGVYSNSCGSEGRRN